ncbi:hypothetical protein GCM10025868_44980 [Angustibacter aerolatus]|uniref:DinB-like domain-containing protein n=1 Tax=Angustibacter aerolatus TaxID=1162965 RepID=A0ABQ6JLX4_9ACTN|nr:DinB family protein [Angustibacter aerolatus]GMA89248.1 hypothetical protein GCM10025868_44980 [Angustibacter aerolatus]
MQRAWDDALARAAALPPGSVDVQVDGEWSFAQTLRHLVMATDLWLGQAVLHLEHPFHPHGLAFEGAEAEGFDLSAFSTDVPTYDEVLTARADRVALVAGFVAEVTPEQAGRRTHQPVAPGSARDDAVVSARDPGGGVGAPALRRPRPRCDRGRPHERPPTSGGEPFVDVGLTGFEPATP